MNEKGILKSGNTTLEKRDSDAVFRKCISNIGLYPEIYYGMISAELAEQQRLEQAENEEPETEA